MPGRPWRGLGLPFRLSRGRCPSTNPFPPRVAWDKMSIAPLVQRLDSTGFLRRALGLRPTACSPLGHDGQDLIGLAHLGRSGWALKVDGAGFW